MGLRECGMLPVLVQILLSVYWAPDTITGDPQPPIAWRSGTPDLEVALVRIPGHDLYGEPLWLEAETAIQYRKLIQYAEQRGYTLRPNFAFRTHKQQKHLYRHRSRRVPVAIPGYSSHQSGIAIDFSGVLKCNKRRKRCRKTPLYYFLLKEAPRFGFERPISREPWHWERTSQTLEQRPLG